MGLRVYVHIELCMCVLLFSSTFVVDSKHSMERQGHQDLSGKSDENKSFKSNQLAPSIYIMIELCFFSLDQWEIRIHLLWGKCFNIPHHCDPRLNQTKFNDSLPLTIPGVLASKPILRQKRIFLQPGPIRFPINGFVHPHQGKNCGPCLLLPNSSSTHYTSASETNHHIKFNQWFSRLDSEVWISLTTFIVLKHFIWIQ